MSMLERMKILGMRSFSPENDEQIKFSTPLTLILGANGTGKTTIIECLRYLTTGESPPNSDRGQAFVHDPKLAGEREVKGQIKLKFKDTGGADVVVTRVLEVVQKQKKMQVKSLDGTIVRTNDKGEKKTITQRCTEIDREMVSMFGVSKAILNNVIFCHQEDSNWPLSEGKTLKEKFDDIFASTRYVKALEKLQSIRKEHNSNANLFTSELRYLEQNKLQATKMSSEIERNEIRLSAHGDRIEKLDQTLSPISKMLEDIRHKEQNIFQVQQDLTKKKAEFQFDENACGELESKIVFKFNGRIEDLRVEIQNFEMQLNEKRNKQTSIEDEVTKLKREILVTTNDQKIALLELGKLNTVTKNHRERCEQRDQLIRNLCSKYGISVHNSGILSSPEYREAYSHLKTKLHQIINELDQTKKRFNDQEKDIQVKLDELNASKSQLSNTESLKTKEVEKNEKLIAEIDSKLDKIQSSVLLLAEVENQLKDKQIELQNVGKELNEEIVSAEIYSLQDDIENLETQVRDLDNEMLRINEQVAVLTALEAARKEKKAKEDYIRKIKVKHEDALVRLLGKIPSDNINESVSQLIRKLKTSIDKDREKQSDLKVTLAQLEGSHKSTNEEVSKKEEELKRLKEQMKLCGSRDLETLITKLETSIKNLQDEKGSSIGVQYLYNSYIDKLKRTDPCCPLCRREFNETQDVDDLVKELNSKLTTLPSEMNIKQKKIEEMQRECNQLVQLRPVQSRMQVLNEEIPVLKTTAEDIQKEIDNCKEMSSELSDKLFLHQADITAVECMSEDLVLWDQYVKDTKKATKVISDSERQLGPVGDRTLTIVNAEKTEIQLTLGSNTKEMKNKQKNLENFRNRRNNLQSEIHRLGSNQNNILKDAQTTQELQNRKSQLSAEISSTKDEINNILEKLLPLQELIRNAITDKDKLIKKKDQTLEESKKCVQSLENSIENLDSFHSKIVMYFENREPEKLRKCQEESETIDGKLKNYEELKQQLDANWKDLVKEIDNQQTRWLNLKDCLSLKMKQERLNILKQAIADLELKLGGFNLISLAKEKKTLLQKELNLNAEINEERGKLKGLENEIKRQKEAFEVDMYRNAVNIYTQKLVQLKTTKVVSNDLQKYYAALDGAIMQYHAMKMTEINKIIKDLWGKTYKGNDIDYLEIRSEASEYKGASNKRQYNYKVVMIKGDVEQVMRGRCSAGQKVLASLIIRLALAETFCMHCGIIALDEPTTNLDKENIDSLCDALAEIVEARSERKFQLIVISHDGEFVNRLGRATEVEEYYYMQKNDRGHSTISRGSIQNNTLY